MKKNQKKEEKKTVFITKYKNHSVYYQTGEKTGFIVDKTNPGEEKRLFISENLAKEEIDRLIIAADEAKRGAKRKQLEEARVNELAEQEKRLEQTTWTVKASDLKDMLTMMKAFCTEVVIRYENKKLNILAMDPANVMFLGASINASQKINGEPTEDKTRAGVNIGVLASILNKFTNNLESSLLISFQKEPKRFKMIFPDGEIAVPMMDLENEARNPDLKFVAKKTMDYASFNKIILLADAVAESITFQSENNNFIIKASGDLSSFNRTMGKTIGGDAKAKYSIEYLKRYKPTSQNITLLWSKDYPLKIIDENKNFVILAPRVE